MLERILRNFKLSLLFTIILVVLGLLRTSVLTKNIGIEEYGVILIIINITLLINSIFNLRVNDVMYLYYSKYKESGKRMLTVNLISLLFVISLIFSVVLSLSLVTLSDWIAIVLYDKAEYAELMRIYAIVLFFQSFEGFYTSLLRINDRYKKVLIPHVVGVFLGLSALIFYILNTDNYSLQHILTMIAIGVSIGHFIALYFAIDMLRKEFSLAYYQVKVSRMKKVFFIIKGVLFHTNITGYLKLASETGGIFLLGVFAGAFEVAIYGISRQLISMFTLVQNNVQNTIIPEINTLWSKRKYTVLYKFLKKYSVYSFFITICVAIVLGYFAEKILPLIASLEYVDALPVFYIGLVGIVITIPSAGYHPLAVCMKKISRRNIFVSMRIFYLGIIVSIGISAINLAIAQVLGSLTVRIFNDFSLMKILKKGEV